MKVSLGPRDKFPLMSEINMIPLIDVSLVLLIIFMVVTPFLVSSALKVNLPKAVTAEPTVSAPVKIMVSARSRYSLDGKLLSQKDLPEAVERALAQHTESTVLIEADRDTPFDAVVKAMDAARQGGAQKLGVATARPEPSAGK